MFLSYALMKLIGISIPNPQFPILMVPIFFIVFFISGLCEESFWQGLVFEPLQDRWNALGAAIILGIVWAVWHIVPYYQGHHSLTWIVWHCINTVLLRVLIVWLYNNTGKSLFAAISFHAMINVSTFLFPNYGSYYDPFITFILLAITTIIVIFLWGFKTLARYRYTRIG